MVVKGQHAGIPQTRARHFTVAVKSDDVDVDFKATCAHARAEVGGWVIEDLQTSPLLPTQSSTGHSVRRR